VPIIARRLPIAGVGIHALRETVTPKEGEVHDEEQRRIGSSGSRQASQEQAEGKPRAEPNRCTTVRLPV
jgi:hypothetical protein